MRAGRFSNHIPQICSRCTQQEDDFHLFFLCHFARAAWFAHPWYIRSDALVHNQDSLLTTITSLMGSHHHHASFQNIFNFYGLYGKLGTIIFLSAGKGILIGSTLWLLVW